MDCLEKETVDHPLDEQMAVDRLLASCRTNRGWQSEALACLSWAAPALRSRIAEGLATVRPLPGNEQQYAAALAAANRGDDAD